MIIQDIKELQIAKHVDSNKQNIEDIIKACFVHLAYNKIGQCITSNQIGMNDYRICVINVIKPFYLVNPIITEHSNDLINHVESCLSFPNKVLHTKRYRNITVQADNFSNPIQFGLNDKVLDASEAYLKISECVSIQRAIDMLDCKSFLDYEYSPEQEVKGFNRNDSVTIVNNITQEEKIMKFKKVQYFLENGWSIKN